MKNLIFTLLLLASASFSFAQIPNYVPSNGLVGWWPFNGNANDESGNGNNGTVNGATLSTDRFGNTNSSYFFNGGSDRIVTNTNTLPSSQTSFTISLWVMYQDTTLYGEIICDRSNSSFDYKYRLHLRSDLQNKPISFASVSNTTTYSSCVGGSVFLRWHHIVVVSDLNSNINTLYFDGTIADTTLGIIYPNITNTTTFGANFAPGLPGYDPALVGNIDDIGIWNRALTQQEITNLYNGNICYQTISVTDTLFINTNITGFNPVTYENSIRIWPNPTNDHITIDAGDLNVMNGYSIRISNSLGQQMFQSAINQQQFYLDLSTWTGNGMYFVNIIDPSGNIIDVKKIVLR
jgi:hypothetical protein